MANILKRLPLSGEDPNDHESEIYLHAVASALEDGKLTGVEAKQLARLAGEAGLGAAQVEKLHYKLLEDMRDVALADGVLTTVERRTLVRAADLLGAGGYFDDLVGPEDGDSPVAAPKQASAAEPVPPGESSQPAQVVVAVYPAGWYPDPWALAEYRYYNGSQWTSYISTGGIVTS